MLNYIWIGLVVLAVLIGGWHGKLEAVTNAAFERAEFSIMKLALPLAGIMALWLGIMRLAERAGLIQVMARALRPVLRRLFPDVPAEHPAMGSMLMNMAANMLGLTNAATPLGIRAMKDLETLNLRPGTATNAMCTFLAINTSSIQLIPATAVGVLAVAGSTNPTAIIGTAFLATICSTIAGITAVKLLEKLPAYRLPALTPRPPEPVTPDSSDTSGAAASQQPAPAPAALEPPAPFTWPARIVLALFGAFFVWAFLQVGYPEIFGRAAPADWARDNVLVRGVKALSLLSIPFLLSFFPLYAALRRVRVYEE
ncbi:MAG: nucleoside recognition domain-containing protein, partial [Verrucomicrobiales bacterium]|nr:nucleoside recognition domain-containing protein [Verrucomicrobiales bacterium]